MPRLRPHGGGRHEPISDPSDQNLYENLKARFNALTADLLYSRRICEGLIYNCDVLKQQLAKE